MYVIDQYNVCRPICIYTVHVSSRFGCIERAGKYLAFSHGISSQRDENSSFGFSWGGFVVLFQNVHDVYYSTGYRRNEAEKRKQEQNFKKKGKQKTI